MFVDPAFDFGEPFVLFADKVAFGEVDKVGDGFSGEEVKAIDDIDLDEGEEKVRADIDER